MGSWLTIDTLGFGLEILAEAKSPPWTMVVLQ